MKTAATRPSTRRKVLPDAVRTRRVELDLTQEQLAEKAGISERTIVAIEAGEVLHPWARTLARLAAGLKTEPDALRASLAVAP